MGEHLQKCPPNFFWGVWTIYLRNKRLPFGEVWIGDDLEMNEVL